MREVLVDGLIRVWDGVGLRILVERDGNGVVVILVGYGVTDQDNASTLGLAQLPSVDQLEEDILGKQGMALGAYSFVRRNMVCIV